MNIKLFKLVGKSCFTDKKLFTFYAASKQISCSTSSIKSTFTFVPLVLNEIHGQEAYFKVEEQQKLTKMCLLKLIAPKSL